MDKRLDEIFATYAGKPVKNPDRLTCDICATTEDLIGKIQMEGYMKRVVFVSQDYFNNAATRTNTIYVEIEEKDVDADQSARQISVITGRYKIV